MLLVGDAEEKGLIFFILIKKKTAGKEMPLPQAPDKQLQGGA